MAISLQLCVVLIMLTIYNLYCMAKKRYASVFIVVVILLTFISKEENGLISGTSYSTGGVINLSIVGYDIILLMLISIILRNCRIGIREKYKRTAIVCTLLLFLVRFMIDGVGFFSNKILDNYLLPIVCALLMIRYLDKEKALKVVRVLYYCILINAIIGSIEYFIGQSLLFHDYYMESVGWYPSTYLAQNYGISFRCTAFLGHPLTNGMFYLMGVVYLFNSPKKWNAWKCAQLAVLTFGIFATNSRGALLVLSIYILFYLVSNKKAIKLCVLAGAGVAICVGLNFPELYSNIFVRDRTGSSFMVRMNAIFQFTSIPLQNVLLGMGYNNAGNLFWRYIGSRNAEISYLILLMENGLIGFIIWIIALVSIYHKKMCRHFCGYKYSGLVNGMLLCFLLDAATSNSFADPGTLTYLLCFILAMSRIGKLEIMEDFENESVMENKKRHSRLSISAGKNW